MPAWPATSSLVGLSPRHDRRRVVSGRTLGIHGKIEEPGSDLGQNPPHLALGSDAAHRTVGS